ncbi:MAG: hypothetical protein NC911_09675, partial [Candidatus Omnitrophica bacterium]|nr:hypothetical protein [Candidatus Omnitrophota bacterium]
LFSAYQPTLGQVGKLLAKEVASPWELPWQDGILYCQEKGQHRWVKTQDLLEEEKRKIEGLLNQIESLSTGTKIELLAKKAKEVKEKYTSTLAFPMGSELLLETKKLREEATELYWNLKIEEVLK